MTGCAWHPDLSGRGKRLARGSTCSRPCFSAGAVSPDAGRAVQSLTSKTPFSHQAARIPGGPVRQLTEGSVASVAGRLGDPAPPEIAMVRRCRHPMFKGRHFDQEIIILCVRWYVTYKLSYRDLAAMMLERAISLAPSTIFRWVDRDVPEFEKRWDRFSRPVGWSWRVDETDILVNGEWCYRYRAIDKQGRTVDLLGANTAVSLPLRPSSGRHSRSHPNRPPRKVTLDGHWPSHRALRLLRREHPAWRRVHVRTCRISTTSSSKITERSGGGVRRCSVSSPSRPQR